MSQYVRRYRRPCCALYGHRLSCPTGKTLCDAKGSVFLYFEGKCIFGFFTSVDILLRYITKLVVQICSTLSNRLFPPTPPSQRVVCLRLYPNFSPISVCCCSVSGTKITGFLFGYKILFKIAYILESNWRA